MKRVLLLGILAACGGKPAPATLPVDNAELGGDAVQARPSYAALFVEGKTWTFDVTFHTSDGDGNVGDDTAVVDCSVAWAKEVEGGKVSSIACAADTDIDTALPLNGEWFLGETGLYKGEGPDGQLILSATPVDAREDEDGEEGSMHHEISHKGDVWCWEVSSAMGDESWESLCLGPDGPTEGTWGWAGGSVQENTFKLKGN
jgi:hypothetical protein